MQYRMSSDVMRLPNALFYANGMKCATAAVAAATLVFPFPDAILGTLPLEKNAPPPPFIVAALDPRIGVLFVSTDAVELDYYKDYEKAIYLDCFVF